MKMNSILTKVFLFSFCFAASQQVKPKVSIYYEALCPDSQHFINHEFTPAHSVIGDYIDVEFVVYGKASHKYVNGGWNFECQHGELECYGNRVQACAIMQSDSRQKTVSFIDCAMASIDYQNDYENQLSRCAHRCALLWNQINGCAKNSTGSYMLAHFGDMTHSVHPRITFVPTVIINDNTVVVRDRQDFRNFLGKICSLLPNKPPGCSANPYSW